MPHNDIIIFSLTIIPISEFLKILVKIALDIYIQENKNCFPFSISKPLSWALGLLKSVKHFILFSVYILIKHFPKIFSGIDKNYILNVICYLIV